MLLSLETLEINTNKKSNPNIQDCSLYKELVELFHCFSSTVYVYFFDFSIYKLHIMNVMF
jgi:hypothetical protein